MLNFLLQSCRLPTSRPHGAMEARWTSNPYGGEVIQRLQVRILLRSLIHFFHKYFFFSSIFKFFFIHFLHFFIMSFHDFDINIFFPTEIRCKIGLLYLFVIMPNGYHTLSGFSKFVPFIPLLFHSLLFISFYTHSLCLKINY